MIILRDYQKNAIERIREKFLCGKRRIILCMPTGAGKTVTFSELARLTILKNKRVMFITHRVELFSQILSANAQIENVCEIKAGSTIEDANCYVAMVETLARRENIPDCDLYIIDEVHIGNFKKIIEQIPEKSFVLGVTATPFSANTQYEMKDLFEDIVEPISVKELIGLGALAIPFHYVAFNKNSDIKMKVKNGEYDTESQKEAIVKTQSGILEVWQKKGFSKMKTLVFNIDVEHSLSVKSLFLQAGYTCEHLDANTPKTERDDIIQRFVKNEIQVLCNVNILTAGFDCPDIECVVLNRKTKSYTLYNQMIGRGSRTTNEKKTFYILDMGNNVGEHGRWSKPAKTWTEIFFNPKKAGLEKTNNHGEIECWSCGLIQSDRNVYCEECNAELKTIECKNCGEINPYSQIECISCNEVLRKEKQKKTALQGTANDAMLIDETPFYEEIKKLEKIQIEKGYKTAWIHYKVAEYGSLGLELYAQYKGYNKKWVDYHQNKCEEYLLKNGSFKSFTKEKRERKEEIDPLAKFYIDNCTNLAQKSLLFSQTMQKSDAISKITNLGVNEKIAEKLYTHFANKIN